MCKPLPQLLFEVDGVFNHLARAGRVASGKRLELNKLNGHGDVCRVYHMN
jgi:hypothetical protein